MQASFHVQNTLLLLDPDIKRHDGAINEEVKRILARSPELKPCQSGARMIA